MKHTVDLTDEQGPQNLMSILRDAKVSGHYEVNVSDDTIVLRRQRSRASNRTTRQEDVERWEQQWSEAAAMISAQWPEGVSAAEAVAEQRR